MTYQRPRLVTLSLAELDNASMNAFLQLVVDPGGRLPGCQCQCQCQCQAQAST